MSVKITFSKSYFGLNAWILANVIQLSTQSFCRRFLDYRNDPCHRMFDQMVMAARSAVANLAEGSARHDTSKEGEMRLSDVARGSIDELFGDYLNYIMDHKGQVWNTSDPDAMAVWRTSIDRFDFTDNLFHDVAEHIYRQKDKFNQWVESDSGIQAANCLLMLCHRLNVMVQKMMDAQHQTFRREGGFTENMTKSRMEAVKQMSSDSNAPRCPKCGGAMVRRITKKGSRQGSEFWGCADYPRCNGLRDIIS